MKKTFTLLTLLVMLAMQPVLGQNSFWTGITENNIPGATANERVIVPDAFTTYRLDLTGYRSFFSAAPMEFTPAAAASPLLIELPMPDKTMAKFMVWESPVMAAGLASQLPGVKTYTGQGLTDPGATVKIDFTYRGFHAMILSAAGDVYIDPYFKNSFDYYLSYYERSYAPANKPRNHCKGVRERTLPAGNTGILAGNGTQLKTYRLAVACTHQYAAFFGGTLAATASAIATTINRVNGVYERELAVRMVLVANNNDLIFTSPITDPFTGNDDPDVLIDESQAVIDDIITPANYDVGHTFSTGAGGLAGLGVVCFDPLKASGVTGSAAPVGDPYDIDFVAHELGHQFGGNHTFNGIAGSCEFNNEPTAAYEVGSGSTIMAYAGICDADNLQPNSDAYFHTINFDEMVSYITTSDGAACAVVSPTGNGFPTVNTGAGGFNIPRGTPFTLTGAATDPNNDPLTYCWEQFDLGPFGINNSASEAGPNFRSFSPTTSPTRTFPRISDIANNTTSFREVLYNGTNDRFFNFRLTARDNKAGGGGVNYAPLTFSVNGAAGPFTVNAPNTALTWTGLSTQTVTWSVASTNAAPVSCANVRITLSTDGGLTYPITVLASTPNDGSQAITVPNVATTTARIRVECVFANYSFFDISNTNFTITFNPIPVSLFDFTARADKSQVRAQWQTSQEINSQSFIVERATDGNQFTAIGSVAAAGNTDVVKRYQFTDSDPQTGLNYYRLKMIDRDASFTYSKVAVVKFNPEFDLVISPNPARDRVTITGKSLNGRTILEIFSASGQRVFRKQFANAPQFREDLDIQGFASGLYRVRITNGSHVVNKKLVVQ
jgi:hypothetical protein